MADLVCPRLGLQPRE